MSKSDLVVNLASVLTGVTADSQCALCNNCRNHLLSTTPTKLGYSLYVMLICGLGEHCGELEDEGIPLALEIYDLRVHICVRQGDGSCSVTACK